MRKRKSVFYPWFAWNVERIENYLEEMAADGWHVERVGFSQLWFRFTKGDNKKIRYCADYQWKPTEEYKQILVDDGWELIDCFSGWMLWRKSYNNDRPHLYTDRASLVERNNRIIALIGVCLMAQIPAISTNAFEQLVTNYLGKWSFAGSVFMVVYICMLVFLVIGLIQLLFLNKKLKN